MLAMACATQWIPTAANICKCLSSACGTPSVLDKMCLELDTFYLTQFPIASRQGVGIPSCPMGHHNFLRLVLPEEVVSAALEPLAEQENC